MDSLECRLRQLQQINIVDKSNYITLWVNKILNHWMLLKVIVENDWKFSNFQIKWRP